MSTIFLKISYTNKVTDKFLLKKKIWPLRPLKKKFFSQKSPKLAIFLGLIKTVPVIRFTSFLEGSPTYMCLTYVSNFKLIGQFVPELLKIKVERASQNYCIDRILEEKKILSLLCFQLLKKMTRNPQTHSNMHNLTWDHPFRVWYRRFCKYWPSRITAKWWFLLILGNNSVS